MLLDSFNTNEQLFHKKKIKLTGLRNEILTHIYKNERPIKAYDLLSKLNEKHKSIKPITLYRILDLFIEKEIIHKIESQNAYLKCSMPDSSHEYCFVMCKQCNNVEEVCQSSMLTKLNEYLRNKSFTIEKIHVEALGVCSKCSNQAF